MASFKFGPGKRYTGEIYSLGVGKDGYTKRGQYYGQGEPVWSVSIEGARAPAGSDKYTKRIGPPNAPLTLEKVFGRADGATIERTYEVRAASRADAKKYLDILSQLFDVGYDSIITSPPQTLADALAMRGPGRLGEK